MPRTPRMAQIEAMLADDPDDTFLRYGLAMEHASAGDHAHDQPRQETHRAIVAVQRGVILRFGSCLQFQVEALLA